MNIRDRTWFPVIFPDRCDSCAGFRQAKCIDYCPNDVFALMNGKVAVVNPQGCVFGCTSCELLCHKKAIVFPGSEEGAPQREPADKGLIRKTTCPQCSRVFWTSRDSDLCFDCERQPSLDSAHKG